MKNLLLTIATFVVCTFVASAQEYSTVPTGLTVHPDTLEPAYSANTAHIDSVTAGASNMKYFVMPDPLIAGTSTFTWAITGGTSTITQDGDTVNLAKANFPSTATGIIWVRETSPAGSCPGQRTRIDYQVIAAPTATGGADPAAQCSSNPATASFAVPLTVTTADKKGYVTVTYRILNPDATQLGTDATISLATSATSATVTLTGASQYGGYTFRIMSVTDNIATKSGVAGTVSAADVTLTVNRIPQTGRIYHLPN